MDIGAKLKTLRNAKGYTLKELAEKTNISISFISDIENGRRYPGFENLKKLAEVLEVSTDFLLSLSEPSKEENDIANPDIRMIARAGLSEEQSAILRKAAEVMFPDAFKTKKDSK